MTLGPPGRRYRLTALIVLAVWANAGCSFLFVDGPPAKHRKLPYFECSSGNGWPIVDGVIGVGVGIGAAAALGSVNDNGDRDRSEALIAAAEAALFLASTVYGFSKTAECREAKAALMLRLQPTSPGDGGWGTQGGPPPDPWAPPPGTLRAPPRGAASPDPWAPPASPPPAPPATPAPASGAEETP